MTEEEIKQLQTKLFTAGFRLVGPADGKLGPRMQMAIREFQRYAKMPQVAKEDTTATGPLTDRLSAVINDKPYTNEIDGEPNDDTLKILDHWVDQNQNWRCPVVIQAWRLKSSKGKCADRKTPIDVQKGRENIWDFDEVRSTEPRMFVFDYSGYFFPVTPGTRPSKAVLGTYTEAKKNPKLGKGQEASGIGRFVDQSRNQ